MNDFTIAIASYNRFSYLKEILERLYFQIENINLKIEVLLIDDASNDLTYSLKKNYPKLNYIRNDYNLGVAKTRNLLVKNSNSKYIIFLDSDVIPCKNFVLEHIKNAKENTILQGVNILIPSIEYVDKKNMSILTDFSTSFFDTSNLCIEKKIIEKENYFDENFYYGWEDLELGIRIKKNKHIKFIKNRLAIGYHIKNFPTNLEDEFRKERERAKGSIYFINKNNSMEVKTITQINNISYFYFLITKIVFLNSFFLRISKKIYDFKLYNLSIFLLRFYMNIYYLNECFSSLKKQKSK